MRPNTNVNQLFLTSKTDTLVANKNFNYETNSKYNNNSEQNWWPTDIAIEDAVKNDIRSPTPKEGLNSRLCLSLSTVYTPSTEQEDNATNLKQYSSSWSIEDANFKWNTPVKNDLNLITPTRIHVTNCSWEDLRIGSPEFEEEDYLLQASYGGSNVTHAESLNDLISTSVRDKIVPEGEEYRIVFISSSSSSKSSDFNDIALEEFCDSDCEAETLNFITKFTNDDSIIKISQNDQSKDDVDGFLLPSQTTSPFVHSASKYADQFYENFDQSNIFDDTFDVKVVDNLESDVEESNVNNTYGFYSFVRTNSARSCGERSISEQCFSNQVFSVVDNQLSVMDVDSVPVLVDNTEMSEHEVTMVVEDEDEDNEQLSASFDSGSSVSDSEVIGSGYIEEVIDSSDDECVSCSYDVSLSRINYENISSDDDSDNEIAVESNDLVINFNSESESVIDINEANESEKEMLESCTINVKNSAKEENESIIVEYTNADTSSINFTSEQVRLAVAEYETTVVDSKTNEEIKSEHENQNLTRVDEINESVDVQLSRSDVTQELIENSLSEIPRENVEEVSGNVLLEQTAVITDKSSDNQLDIISLPSDETVIAVVKDVDENSPEEINSELDKSDTDSQDTVIEGETYRRMRQVAIREKLLLANREWSTSLEDLNDETFASLDETVNEVSKVSELSENDQKLDEPDVISQDTSATISTPVVNLHELIAKSRALSATFKQGVYENDLNVNIVSTPEASSSILEKYFMTSLEHMAPLELDRNRNRQQTIIKPSNDESPLEAVEIEAINFEVLSEKSSEETSEAYDSDRRFEDSSTEEDVTFDEDDDDTSSTVSSSSDEGSMYLRPLLHGGFQHSDEAILMCRQTLDMSLHTIMEESCEESESEDRRKPMTSNRNSVPSELQRYFEFSFAGTNVHENSQCEDVKNINNSVVAADVLNSVSRIPLLPGDRLSRTDSELSYDTMSETESSIFSENENRDEDVDDDEELARLASSRLEKYFLTGLLGGNVGNYFGEDISQNQTNLPISNTKDLTSNKEGDNKHTKLTDSSNRSQSESSNDDEIDDTSLGAFEMNDGCDTIKRNKPKVDVTNAHNLEGSKETLSNASLDFTLTKDCGESLNIDIENRQPSFDHKNKSDKFIVSDNTKNSDISVNLLWKDSVATSASAADTTRSLMQLDWKQQSRDSGFIGSSDDLLQDANTERVIEENNLNLKIDNTLLSGVPKPEQLDEMSNLLNRSKSDTSDMIVEETMIGVTVISSQLPASNPTISNVNNNITTTPSVSCAFGLFRSSSRSTKSGRSVNLYTSDDEAQYIVNQLVNHIAKSMSRSPQLSRAKPPEIEEFESELTKLMQTVPAIEFTVKEIVEELSSTDHYSDSYESSDISSDQEGPVGPLLPFQLPNKVSCVDLERNDSGRSWRSYGSNISKNSSFSHRDFNDEMMSEETMFIYDKFMDSLTKMAEHMSEDAKSNVNVSNEEKMRFGANFSNRSSASSSGKGSPPTAVKIVEHIRTKLTSLMREVQIDRSPSIGSGRSSFNSNTGPTIMWNKPGSGSGSAAGDELSISSTTSSAHFDSEDSPTDTELSMDSDDQTVANLTNSLVISSNALKSVNSNKTSTLNSSFDKTSNVNNSVPQLPSQNPSAVSKNSDHLTLTGRPLSLMEKTPTDDESEDGLERWSSDITIVEDDIRYSSIHKSEPMLLSQSSSTDVSKTLPASHYYGLSSHPNPTSRMRHSRGSMGSLLGAGGSSSSGITTSGPHGNSSAKSDWDMWKSISKGGQTSGQRNLPTKYKSCDPLPTTKSTTNSVKSTTTSTTPRDKKKHTFAFMSKQKSGSSSSLRDASNTQETTSIKQQIQFRSSLHLTNLKGKDEQTQPQQQQQQQQRSSSMHWLFGRNKDSSKKGNLPTLNSGGWSSNPDGISRIGVDVATAQGVDLSDNESSGHNGNSGVKSHVRGNVTTHINHQSSSANSVTNVRSPSLHLTSVLSNSLNPSVAGKASTLPRTFPAFSSNAGNDTSLHANVSFLHKSQRYLASTTNTLPVSFSSNFLVNNDVSINDEHRSTTTRFTLAPQPRPRSVTSIGISNSERSSIKSSSPAIGRVGNTKDAASPALSTVSKTSATSNTETHVVERDVHSWPDESGNFIKISSKGPNFVTTQRKPTSEIIPSSRYGTTLSPNVIVDEGSEKGSRLGGSGAGSHTGSSDPDNFQEEDIDRYVAMHNRSLSSLGVCSESMSSVYSAAGGGHYGNVTVRGEVEFGLSYNYITGALEVNIKQCHDLAAVDTKRNRSDPYVKVYLLPDKSKGGKRKTRVKKHTLNPIFNEVLKFYVTISELETRTLWVTVWHSDMFGRNEFLGEVTLPMGYEAWEDTSPKWYQLQEKLGSPEEVYSYKGDLVLALKFVPPEITSLKKGRISKGSLYVLVKEARNLMAVSTNGTSDPFCKSYLLPDKGKGNKQKTHVIKRTCNPKWNHTFVYEDVSLEEIKERCLELTIWDYDRLTSNDFLGGIRLSGGSEKHRGRKVDWMDSRGEEITLWQTMLEKPNVWVDGSVLLRPTMDHRQSP